MQVVCDDLLVSNSELLCQAAAAVAANTVPFKPLTMRRRFMPRGLALPQSELGHLTVQRVAADAKPARGF